MPDTKEETPLIAPHVQDFSESGEDILDNFADGPDPHDDGTPMGLGGEKGVQSEPASSTLEADMAKDTKPGETSPPEDSAPSEPVQDAGEEGPETSPEPEEPETPDFPPVLLQMAGLADAAAAQAAGFKDPDALFVALKWRGQLLTPSAAPAQSTQPSEQRLYRRPAERATPPAPPAPEPEAPKGEVKPFELPAEMMDRLDEDWVEALRLMNAHYQQADDRRQKEIESLRTSMSQRESELARQQEEDEAMRFDQIVQNLRDWQDVFGEGNGDALARAGQFDPVAMTNCNHRALLFDAVQAIREINAKQGYKPMSLEQEVHWALMQRYPDKFQQTISGNSTNSGRKRGVTASRPTQRRTPPKSQNAKLLSDVNAMLRKKGRPALSKSPEEEFDGDI